MTSTSFSIAYDGPALRDGRMEVRDLAPALLAVGQLFDAVNRIINGDQASIKVNVVATREGSFEVLLGVDQDIIQKAVEFLGSDEAEAAINLRELIVGGGTLAVAGIGGLIWLVRRLLGRNPDKLEKLNNDWVRITTNNETFEVPIKLLRLYKDIPVRDALQRLISEPLEREGIEKFVASDSTHKETVGKDEAPYFKRPDLQDNMLTDDTKRVAFSIVSLTFKQENKWRLHDGSNTISAVIADEEFLSRVASNEVAFSKGDILICEVRMMQFRSGNKLKTEHTIQRVIEHKRAMRQIPLNLEAHEEEEK